MKGSNKDHVSAKSLKNEITGKIKAAINSAGGLAAKSIEKKIEKASKKLARKVIKASLKLKKEVETKMRQSEKSSAKGLKIASRKLASSKLVAAKPVSSNTDKKKNVVLPESSVAALVSPARQTRVRKPKIATADAAAIPAKRRRRSAAEMSADAGLSNKVTPVKPTQTRTRSTKAVTKNAAAHTETAAVSPAVTAETEA